MAKRDDRIITSVYLTDNPTTFSMKMLVKRKFFRLIIMCLCGTLYEVVNDITRNWDIPFDQR